MRHVAHIVPNITAHIILVEKYKEKYTCAIATRS